MTGHFECEPAVCGSLVCLMARALMCWCQGGVSVACTLRPEHPCCPAATLLKVTQQGSVMQRLLVALTSDRERSVAVQEGLLEQLQQMELELDEAYGLQKVRLHACMHACMPAGRPAA